MSKTARPATRAAGPPDVPRDAAERARIVDDLDTTMLVEAGAGSGKTKSLVDRMIALIATGRATIPTIAAVTFTRKAAAELRGRFQVALERSLAAPPREGEKAWGPEEKARLRAALRDLEQGFIGTIHSFCAGLLRERPVECGIDPEFEEMEEIDDAVFREACWHDFLAAARLGSDDLLRELDDAGLLPEDLRDGFDMLAMYPEVLPKGGREEPPDFEAARARLVEFLDETGACVPEARPAGGWDKLQVLLRRVCRRRARLGLHDPRLLMETFELLERSPGCVQKKWGSKEEAMRVLAEFEAFKRTVAVPALTAWREFRHARALAFLVPALDFYRERRKRKAKLNFGDQLLFAAGLLRDNPEVRAHFQERYRAILVDEFQDTDPIQAEILFYLTGTDRDEKDWTRLAPAPGSLFLVGDPKQSIYRFRRADIDTYNLAKRVIVRGGGEVLELTANFRSLGCIADYVNGVFGPHPEGGDGSKGAAGEETAEEEPDTVCSPDPIESRIGKDDIFPAEATEVQAKFAPLEPVRGECDGGGVGVFKIPIPTAPGNFDGPIAAADAEAISAFIADAISGGLKVHDRDPRKGEFLRPAQASDFLILFRYKKNMDVYARGLEEKGILYEVSGSDAFSECGEIVEIIILLQALRDPSNPVLTVAALRGLFFGVSDQELLDFRIAGGSFDLLTAFGRDGAAPDKVGKALAALREWAGFARAFPPSVAIEKILEASGLLGSLVSQKMGSSRAGNVLKLVEIVRGLEAEGTTSFAEAVEFIAEPGRLEAVEEMSLTPARRDAVRLMNLHKAKGLEAPVVFLANPAGMRDHEPDKHIVRPREGSTPAPGGGPLGYFVFKKRSRFTATVVSQPVGWAEAAASAAAYQEAEEHRLMYVAATRARDMLVISSYEGVPRSGKAWDILDAGLAGCPVLPVPAAKRSSAPSAKFKLAPGEPAAARTAIRERRAAAGRPSYRLETVTGMVRAGAMPEDWDGGGHGREWGTAVHAVLSSVGRAWARRAGEPGASAVSDEDLRLLAANALASAGGARSDEEDLAALVRSILTSEFWGRAALAGRRFFEVPFSLRLGPDDPDYGEIMGRGPLVVMAGTRPVAPLPGAPVLFTGAIDLVFLEEGGWVIADYKTDRIAEAAAGRGVEATGRAFDALVEHYRPQVELYSRFWEKTTGETVKEAGLYFTSLDVWKRLR